MCALKVPNEGEIKLLDKILHDGTEVLSLRLFNNNYTPDDATTISNFSEATFTNYVALPISSASFGAAETVSDKASSTFGSAQTWTCGSTGDTVYGYFVMDSVSKILWAEKFGTARVVAENDTISIQPSLTLNSES